ncbi:TPA: hypothetical protein EYP66_20020 [Candidatus Poribacteria bacterium]|nr:hypothetical protein [Candidatus Poribacteria bacterium]
MMRAISIVLFTLMFGLMTTYLCAKTIQDFGKWNVGENLLENSGFEENTDAWTLEAGAGGNRNCVISWVIEKCRIANFKLWKHASAIAAEQATSPAI